MKLKISVSFIKSKYNEKETIDLINKTSANYLHLDIMDGIFVKNKNYTFEQISSFLVNNQKPLDIHLMCEINENIIKKYASLNPAYITFHLEATNDILKIIDLIHSYNIKCGISIKPNTDVEQLKPYLSKIEQVLIMSVEPGLGGQSFIKSSENKINKLSNCQGSFIISVDGGINNETINLVQKADMVVSGSYVCLSDNYEKQIETLR